jgi:hypothetical protein
MIVNFKALGLAVAAALAISALAAAGAQAKLVFTLSSEELNVHATGESIGEKFTVDGVTTECKTSHYTGLAKNNSGTIELTPEYTGCTLAGTGLTVHVRHRECKYHFTLTERVGLHHHRAHVKIVCPPGQSIQIEGTGTSCEATVGEAGNTNLTTVDITTDTAAGDVTIKPNVVVAPGITANVTKDGFLCPFNGTGHKSGGTYTATGYITGTATGGTIAVSGE